MRALLLASTLLIVCLALFGESSSPDSLDAIESEPMIVRAPGQVPCPSGGVEMVRLPEGFCIDTMEVTRAQYREWLDTNPSVADQDGACSDNGDFTPTCNWDRDPDQPVVCVDWCDAKAYCEGVGKRLCGAIGGGPYDVDSYADAATSEWFAACSSGGRYDYTYGDELDTTICRGADAEDYTTWGLADVGSFAECHSPDADYAAVFDLSGHVAEWDDACNEQGCRIRGGSYQHHAHGLRCAMGERLFWPRTRTVSAVGIRCCAD